MNATVRTTDEQQVREMLARWGQLHADKDADRWSQLWTEDGTYVNPRRDVFAGRAAIRQYLVDRYTVHPPDRYIRHIFSVPIVRVDGDTAEISADYASLQCDGNKPAFIGAIGRHHATLIRRDGGWLFTEYRIVNPYE
jgi:uncharacterized protein (TIGR02246 family)